jgi:hypothetical protein
MPDGVDLKTARRFVAGQDRVSARLLMDVFRLEQRAALQMVQDMERLGDIARPDDSGWHAVLARDADVQPLAEPDGLAAALAATADWRLRAEAAEARLAAGMQDKKFDRLKRRLAREFHPDQAAASEIDRVVREVVFRRLWQIVQEVEDA